MISITEFNDFRRFLSLLISEIIENETQSINSVFEDFDTNWLENDLSKKRANDHLFWYSRISSFRITKFILHDNFDYYASVDISFENDRKSDIFTNTSFLILNTNLGLMVMFPNARGSICRIELNFDVENKVPDFLIDMTKAFYSEDMVYLNDTIRRIRTIGTVGIDEIEKLFKRNELKSVFLE
jgi:hypothetical protein